MVSARNSRQLLHPLINVIAFCREAPEVTPCCLSNQALASHCPTSPEQGAAPGKSCLFPMGSGAEGGATAQSWEGEPGRLHPKDTLITPRHPISLVPPCRISKPEHACKVPTFIYAYVLICGYIIVVCLCMILWF